MSEIAARLRAAREKTGLTAVEAAARFGWVPSTYYGHENGSRGIPHHRLVDYAKAYKVNVGWLLTGALAPEILEITRKVAVVGEVAAGVWQEVDTWDGQKYDDVPTIPGRYEHLQQVAYLVRGPSMDLERIFDGDFVIVVAYFEARRTYEEGDIVLVTRRNGSLIERTVKSLHLLPDGLQLTPKSSDPRFQKPIVIQPDSTGVVNSEVEITGLVIATHRRLS